MVTPRSVLFAALIALGALGALAPRAAQASGTYRAGSSKAAAIDMARYDLGKRIYQGEVALPAAKGAHAAQTQKLAALQKKLPVQARRTARLPELAGRLDATHMEALEYFLLVRYRVS